MIKKIWIILTASFILSICLTGCLNEDEHKRIELGERYDSDKIG